MPDLDYSAALREQLGIVRGRAHGLLAYCDPNIDLVFRVAQAPRADQKVLGERLGGFAGGTVANAGCAASSMGCRTLAFGRIGDDADGRFLTEEFRRFGVDTRHVHALAGTPSAAALVLVDAGGEKAVVYMPMPGRLDGEAGLADAIGACAILYAMPYDFGEFAALHLLARAAGTRVAIDVEAAMLRKEGDIERLLDMADIVFMNEATWRHAFRAAPTPAGMQAQLSRQAALLVLTQGSAGARAATRHAVQACAAFPAELIDSTGAGDCFNGAFLAALLDGGDLVACLRFASAAASFAVRRFGARIGIPTRVEVDRLLVA